MLRFLDVSNNVLNGSLSALSTLTGLTYVSSGNVWLQCVCVWLLEGGSLFFFVSTYSYLNVSWNRFSGPIPPFIASSSTMQYGVVIALCTKSRAPFEAYAARCCVVRQGPGGRKQPLVVSCSDAV